MIKNVLFLVVVLVCFSGFSQEQGSVSLVWKPKSNYAIGDNSYSLPQFSVENFQFNTVDNSIVYFKTIPTLSLYDEKNALDIYNVAYESISESELGDLSKKSVPTSLKYWSQTYRARDKTYLQFFLSPIISENGVYKKVVSFSYRINQSAFKSGISTQSDLSIENSVLATGDWYRFYVKKSGVYKLSKSFLQGLGLNTNVDPRRIKIYGNGGRMVPLQNSEYYPNDLTENAVQVVGEEDGVFDSQDYVLFYAEGVDNWNQENFTNLNLYEDKSYYYVTTSGDLGKRIPEIVQPTANPTTTITTFDDYQFHEVDNVNVLELGRIWFGESFSVTNERTFDFTFPNLVTTVPVDFNMHFVTESSVVTTFSAEANGQVIGSQSFQAVNPESSEKAINRSIKNAINLSSDNVAVKIKYENNGVPNSKAYLNFIRIKAKRNLAGYNKQFRFQSAEAGTNIGVGEYQISNASSIKEVWDITDIYNVQKIENVSGSGFAFRSNLGEIKKYVAVDGNDYYTPLRDSKARVENQNLKGTVFKNAQGQFQDVDYLIVTPKNLATQAEKLANFHRNYSQMNVKVIHLESIYPEFSSGKQDIGAIRNFVKYVYNNASSSDKRVKYLNLFGDASFDFKNRIQRNTNIVPIYQAINSFTDSESSFASDDFFGLMDDNEGQIDYATENGSFPFPSIKGLDVAVGRMIASSAQQAEELVNKVIEYHDIKSYGNWRNNYVAISDDADKASDASLQQKQNALADLIVAQKPFINANKILMDSYVQETSAGGKRYPKAREEIFAAFEKGALVFNYLGHGGEDGLSHERIWEKSDGQNLNNRYKYPLFITITCSFSRFDNPTRPTAGEYTYWNPKGGAISMITTVRSIGQGQAETFNNKLAEHIFSYNSNNENSIAENLRLAKNFSPSSATNVVFYLGDPALKLAIAEPKVVLTKVNDIAIADGIPDFQSLAPMKISGEVQDENNNLLSSYNGELAISIFDKQITRATLNNDFNSPPMNFNVLGETIFRGNATVNNGKFEISFVVPRDIRIPLGNGKISFYAKRNQIHLDKTGYNTDIKIGGINTNAVVDNTGPTVRLYMNDETFVNGGITNASPFLLAILEDEHGINTASGIGHDIIGILDGDESNPYIMNDYYETELDDHTRGRVYFPYRNLAPGLHTIVFKAWDVYNNPITAEIQFVVVGDESVTLKNVLNYPNPFVNYTEFWFSHNRPFEPLDVQVQVMTITGKIVWTKNQTVINEGFLSRDIIWDGKDDFGDKIGKGVYVYKLTVKSTLSNKRAEKIEKLVIL
jgi:hypothetical protein